MRCRCSHRLASLHGVDRVTRDGRTWRIGTDADVAWITDDTAIDRTITSAIPPVFEAYATVVLPAGGKGQDAHDQAVLGLLSAQSASLPWWLGYLDTGADDRSWLVSTLWDDDWTCLGGPAELVGRFVRHPGLQARPVVPGQDATPPGHQSS
jgi:hypothetical protein